MKIIIAGAGDVGFHLAKLLAYEKHDIMVVDLNEEKLRNISTQLDVGTLKGNSTSYQMLEEAGVRRADLFIAVTSFEDTNITSAIFAKHLGAKRTIARVKNNNHVDPREKAHLKTLGIDEIISTENLASKEIRRLLTSTAFTDFFQFEGGKLNLLGTVLDKDSPMLNQTLKQCSNLNPDHDFITAAILRNGKTIIPHGETVFQEDDHVYFVATPTGMKRIQEMSCADDFRMKNIMILGGTEIGYMTALTLSNAFNVKIIEENKARSFELSDMLPNALVVCGDGRDRQLLVDEGLRHMDAFIAVTGNSETNIISSLMAKEQGVRRTVALVENVDYVHLSQNIGIDTMINRKLIAADFIFRYVRKGDIISIASIHGVDAEVLEFYVKENSKITSKYLKHLRFPKNALIGGVVRKDKALVPNGDFRIRKDDRVVVLCTKSAINEVEDYFR